MSHELARMPSFTEPSRRQLVRQSRDLQAVHRQTRLRLAAVQAEGLVQTEKLREVDNLDREAMNGQAFLAHRRYVLAAGDQLLADRLGFYTNLARAGKGEIIAEAIASFCQESRLPFRQTSATLGQLERQTLVRLATVRAKGLVQTEKLREVDNLAEEAMNGDAFLARWLDVLAAGDPLLADELSFFADLAHAGKGEIIADTISSYCRESR